MDDDNSKELIDCMRTNDDIENDAERDIIKCEAFKNYLEIGLTEREFETLKYRYGFYSWEIYTLKELAPIFEVSHERVKQIEKKAILKLRNYFNGINDLKKTLRKTKNRQAS